MIYWVKQRNWWGKISLKIGKGDKYRRWGRRVKSQTVCKCHKDHIVNYLGVPKIHTSWCICMYTYMYVYIYALPALLPSGLTVLPPSVKDDLTETLAPGLRSFFSLVCQDCPRDCQNTTGYFYCSCPWGPQEWKMSPYCWSQHILQTQGPGVPEPELTWKPPPQWLAFIVPNGAIQAFKEA